MQRSLPVSRLLYLVLLVTAFAWSQSSYTAAVRGTVSDPSGAAVPGAKVTLTEAERGIAHGMSTDQEGRYFLTALPPGKYTLLVEAGGFKRYARTSIQLAVQQQATLDIKLQVGDIATTIEVQSTAPLLNTTIATLGQVIDNKNMVSLPNIGRNPLFFLTLTPGVVGANGQTTTPTNTNFVANGARNSTSDVLIDGAIANTTEQNTGATDLKYVPSVDAVQEVKIQTNFFAAEYAESGGAIVNVVTKSGTNEFHGDAFYFRRDSTLNANSWSNNRNGVQKSYYRRDQPGGVIGGPIRKNKTFFFGTFQLTRSKSPQTFTGSAPIASFRTGDFSQLFFSDGKPITIYNPFDTYKDASGAVKRHPFANNIIPKSMLDPVALKAMRYIPLPNTIPTNRYTNSNNFYMQGIDLSDAKQADIKLDNSFGEKARVMGRYSIVRDSGTPANLWAEYDPAIAAAYSPNNGPDSTHTQQISSKLVYLQNPTTVWELNYGFVYSNYQNRPFQYFDSTALGLPKYMSDNASYKTFPYFDGWGLDIGTRGFLIIDRQEGVHQISASMTKIKGGHSIKAGTEFRYNFLDYAQPGYPQGHFSFGQRETSMDPNAGNTYQGSGFASFLLGWGNGGDYNLDPKVFNRAQYWGFFVQDDWKLTRKLTLNLGLRYEFDVPRWELQNRFSYWDFSAPAPISVPGYTTNGVYKFVDDNTRSPFDKDLNNFAPRLGFAYALNSKTAIRAGAGIFYTLSRATVSGHTGSPFNTNSSPQFSLDSGATQFATLTNPYPVGLTLPLGSSLGDATFIGRGASTIDRTTGQNPELYQWNFSIQREVGWDSVLEVNYTGSRGAKLPNSAARSLTLLDQSYWSLGRTALQARVPNPFYGIITDPQATNLNGPTVQRYRLLRNMPQFDGASRSEPETGDSWYNALQIKWEKRFSKGLSMLAHYTWAKMEDDVSNGSTNLNYLSTSSGGNLQNLFDYRQEKSLSANDVAHRFVATGVYDLPVGKGKQFARDINRVVDGVIGGWEVSGIFTLQTSTPLQVTQSGGTLWSGSQRPNLLGDPATSGSVYDRFNDWFNVPAFSRPPTDVFGSAPRFLNIRGPMLNTLDMALTKSWKTTERQRLEFRSEASNVRNHPIFNPPGTAFGSGNFGQISSTKIGARNVQLSLKYYF
ncbi:MAG: TonB-dependent receptor domain-containing protein [Bryobacteraceae bacterium]